MEPLSNGPDLILPMMSKLKIEIPWKPNVYGQNGQFALSSLLTNCAQIVWELMFGNNYTDTTAGRSGQSLFRNWDRDGQSRLIKKVVSSGQSLTRNWYRDGQSRLIKKVGRSGQSLTRNWGRDGTIPTEELGRSGQFVVATGGWTGVSQLQT